MQSVASLYHWLGFGIVVILLLAVDLGALSRRESPLSFKGAMAWTLVCVIVSCLFGAMIYGTLGSKPALEYAAGYLLEEALSIDNLFVFIVIFRSFSVPEGLHHRVLFWGIFGAIVLRATFIFAGTALVQKFHAITYIFGAILLITAIRLAFQSEKPLDPTQSTLVRLARRIMPLTDGYRGKTFFSVENGRRMATPLFLVLLVVEASDVVFALDSIPAIFAVTQDPFIVYTSNIFAIVGLRSLYFVLADVIERFSLLKYGLAAVLFFVGLKLLIVDFYAFPIHLSLLIIAGLIGGSILISFLVGETSHHET